MNLDVLQPITTAHAWGGCDVFEEDPAIVARTDAFYVPYLENAGWGLFDSQDCMLMGGVDLVLPEGWWLGQSPVSPVSWREIAETAPDGTYVYGGRLKTQYGHFIVDVLSRQWPRIRQAAPRSRILVHRPDPQAFFAQHPFAQERRQPIHAHRGLAQAGGRGRVPPRLRAGRSRAHREDPVGADLGV